MKRVICSFLLFVLIVPTTASAHVEPIKTPVKYIQQVFIKDVSIDDDDNFWGAADVFFDFIVDAINPPHDEQAGVTTDTVSISSGDSKQFDPPIEIYSHKTCHCDEEFDIDVAVFDYTPIQSGLITIFKKGAEWLKSYLLSGTTGLIVNIIGDVLDEIIDNINDLSLSDEEKEYQAYVKLIEDSDHLGSMRVIIDTPCQPTDATYTSDLIWEDEAINGTLSYQIVKTKTDELCEMEEIVKTPPAPKPKPEVIPEAEKPKVVEPDPEADAETGSSEDPSRTKTDVTEEPAVDEPAVDEPAVDEPAVDEPADSPETDVDKGSAYDEEDVSDFTDSDIDPADISLDIPEEKTPEKVIK